MPKSSKKNLKNRKQRGGGYFDWIKFPLFGSSVVTPPQQSANATEALEAPKAAVEAPKAAVEAPKAAVEGGRRNKNTASKSKKMMGGKSRKNKK